MGFLSKLFGLTPKASGLSPRAAPWNVDFVVIDVETACSRTSSICQIGIVGFRDGREVEAYETLVDPRDNFDGFNIGLHGISPSHVRGQPTFAALHSVVSAHLGGRITVAHSSFDRGALASVCARDALPEISTRWLDSVRVARRAWPDLSSHRLNVLADHLGITHHHHDALSDARAAGMVIVKAIDHTGIGLEEWLTPPQRDPTPSLQRSGGAGPLAGHSVSFTGEFSVTKAELADQLAAAGASTTAGPTRKTTIFVVGDQDLASLAGKDKSNKHLKAEDLRASGQQIQIVDEAGLRRLMSNAAAYS
jgi:DNA polymerase-3 subunit epsilon